MTVYELTQMLKDMDPDAEVKIVLEQCNSMEYAVGDVQEVPAMTDGENEDGDQFAVPDEDGTPTLYLVTGDQTRYLPAVYCDALGVR